MTQEEKLQIEQRIIDVLKTVYDPEIPVNVYDLGLIYRIDLVRQRVEAVEGVKSLKLNVVFEPAWDKEMMSDEAKLDLGLL